MTDEYERHANREAEAEHVRLRLVSDGTVRGTHVYAETRDGQRFEVEDVVSVNWHASANDEPTCRLEINDLVADVAGGEVEAVDPEVERKELAALEKSLDELASADDRRALAGEDTPGGADALPALLNVARAAEAAAAMGVPTTDAEVAAWIAARDALRAALAELETKK